jgi:hypothetical protein
VIQLDALLSFLFPFWCLDAKGGGEIYLFMFFDALLSFLFPFWCLDAKGGGEIYLFMFSSSLYLDLACKTITLVRVGCVDIFKTYGVLVRIFK